MFDHTDITGAFEFLYDMPVLLVVLKKITSLSIPKGLYIAIGSQNKIFSATYLFCTRKNSMHP